MQSAEHETTESDLKLEDNLPDWGWKSLMILGAVMVLGGVLAFFNPFAASLTVEFIAGFSFCTVGLIQIWLAATSEKQAMAERGLTGALGVVLILLAASLLINPLAGLVTLTILVAILFALMGMMRVGMAWRARPRKGSGWMMASGIMSLVLALLIVLGLPSIAGSILGLFLALDLTFSGIATMVFAWEIRKNVN